jgi:hypothetical protein
VRITPRLGFDETWPPKGGGAEAESCALVQRPQEQLALPLTESGGAMRTKWRYYRKLLCSFAARGGGAKADSSALVQRFQ